MTLWPLEKGPPEHSEAAVPWRRSITTLDEGGQVRDFVTSGITPDEHRQLAVWPDGQRLFEGFQHLPAPLRLRDVPAYVRSLGISSTLLSELLPTKTLQGTPMRHRGAHVGNFFLGDKEGGQEFTSEDEEVLVLFAAQAATAIANARTHQDERRARADLEALIETSPVGVVAFDTRTGAPVSFNREARRIVEGLLTPGRPPEELLSVATCHRADGTRHLPRRVAAGAAGSTTAPRPYAPRRWCSRYRTAGT